MDSGSDPIPDTKSADFEYCGGQIETRPVWTDWLGNSKLRFRVLQISDDLSETGDIDDDSLRLNAMQGHGLEDADMPASQWRLGGKCRTF